MNGDITMADPYVTPLLSLQVDPPAKGAKRLKIDGQSSSCPEYLGQLIHDKKVITALPMYGFSTYHVIRLLNQEIEHAAMRLPLEKDLLGDMVTSELYLPEPDPREEEEEITDKVFAPKLPDGRRDINMVGRLLGPQGVILQALEANTGTKVTIRGKQSLRKGQKPRPGDDEELHVIIACKDTPHRAKIRMAAAQRDLMTLWAIPKVGEFDEVKTRQLRLAKMMEGNYNPEEEEMDESVDPEIPKPPVDYDKDLNLPPLSGEERVTLTAKVPIPVDDKPDFNWVGRIIGPGGVTLKSLETKTGCKVSLRGKGSVRESEVASGVWKPSMDSLKDPLHILITSMDETQRASIRLQRCIDEAKKILILPDNPEDDEVKKEQQRFLEDNKKRRQGSLPPRNVSGGPTPLMVTGGGFHGQHPYAYGRMPGGMPGNMSPGGGMGGRNMGPGGGSGGGGGGMFGGGGIGDSGFDGFYDGYSWGNSNDYSSGRGGGKMQSATRGRVGQRGGFGQGGPQGMSPGFGMGGGGMGANNSGSGMSLRVQPYPLIAGSSSNRGGRMSSGGGRQSSYLGGSY